MSKYRVPDRYDQIICPYDVTHSIDAKTFQKHILRCRRSHPHIELKHCPFNHTHLLKVAEYQHHISICPDRVRLDQDMKNSLDGSKRLKGNLAAPPIRNHDFESEENWDDEDDGGLQPNLIAMKHSQGDHASVIHKYQQINGFNIPHRGQHRGNEGKARIPQQMPQVLLMQNAALGDVNNRLALAGIGRGAPSVSGDSITAQSNIVKSLRGPTEHDINNLQSINVGRGMGRGTPVDTPGGLQARYSTDGVSSGVLGSMPGVARGRGRGRGRGTTLDSNYGSPSPASSLSSDSAATIRRPGASPTPVFDSTVKPQFVTPNLNKQTNGLVNGHAEMMPTNEIVNGHSENVEPNDDADYNKEKHAKKLAKKLRAIMRLEEKQAEGIALTADEMQKLELKEDIIEQLSAMGE